LKRRPAAERKKKVNMVRMSSVPGEGPPQEEARAALMPLGTKIIRVSVNTVGGVDSGVEADGDGGGGRRSGL
jgi:hypothetical protein